MIGDATKTENSGNDCHYQKDQSPVEHVASFVMFTTANR